MQDHERQVDALFAAGIEPMHIYSDKNSGSTFDRPGWQGVLRFASDGDAIVVHTLDRLGRTVRDTLNMIHDAAETGVVLDTCACLQSSPARNRVSNTIVGAYDCEAVVTGDADTGYAQWWFVGVTTAPTKPDTQVGRGRPARARRALADSGSGRQLRDCTR